MSPLTRLFLVFIPLAGVILACLLMFLRPAKFLAPYALLMPLVGSYCAYGVYWGLGEVVTKAGFGGLSLSITAILGLLGGGVTGAALGAFAAHGLNQVKRLSV